MTQIFTHTTCGMYMRFPRSILLLNHRLSSSLTCIQLFSKSATKGRIRSQTAYYQSPYDCLNTTITAQPFYQTSSTRTCEKASSQESVFRICLTSNRSSNACDVLRTTALSVAWCGSTITSIRMATCGDRSPFSRLYRISLLKSFRHLLPLILDHLQCVL